MLGERTRLWLFFPRLFFPRLFFPRLFFPRLFFPDSCHHLDEKLLHAHDLFFTSDIFLSPSLGYDAFGTKRFGRNEMGTMRGGLLWVSTKTPCSI